MNKITNQYAILDNNSKNIMTPLHKDEIQFIINIGDGSDTPTMRPKTGCLVSGLGLERGRDGDH